MTKQKNQYYLGRRGQLVYYRWRDVYCVRTKGSLDRRRFYADKAFAGARKRAVEFGEASKLAAEVYQLLPPEFKKRGFIGTLTGWAHKGLMAGESKEAVQNELLRSCGLDVPGKISKIPIEACTCRYIRMEPAQRYGKANTWQTINVSHRERMLQHILYTNETLKASAPVVGIASG